MRRGRSCLRRDGKSRQQKKSGKKSWKGGMLLSTRRRGNTSWSVFAVWRQQWRRIQMHWGRESGLVALSSMKDLLVVWFIHVMNLLLCSHVLDFLLYCHLLHLSCVIVFSCTWHWSFIASSISSRGNVMESRLKLVH
jgi:hypothetical protein